MKRYISIHCHFYQPPRENPWLEYIEVQDTAGPYHDWNERINKECYAPNSFSRVKDAHGKVIDLVNNYSNISFNFGPTLLSWLERHDQVTYQRILDADRLSMEKHRGHGNAIAQAYNHMIMPLAEAKDKLTQVLWGIEDFKYRFNRNPEGMWLPETAVNSETLEILADNGIKFTVLSPFQAKQIRKLDSGDPWHECNSGIDPTRSYVCKLKSGKTMSLFFYDSPISHAVAFEGLLSDGLKFSNRLLTGYNTDRKWNQLLHIATDGETYGHHFKFGEMALSYALKDLAENHDVVLTNYGEYLELYPPEYEVEIHENSSWSCFHGIERWRSNCGCSTGFHQDWTQQWRTPLRDGLNELKFKVNQIFEEKLSPFLLDPWIARNDYIYIVLHRSEEHFTQFFEKHQKSSLSQEEQLLCLKLMEMQHQAMLMFTSCGWFFDDISGIETVQILKHAGRVIQIAGQFGYEIEKPFLKHLQEARSNIPKTGNGLKTYRRWVKPSEVDLDRVVAHYAITTLFQNISNKNIISEKASELFSFKINQVTYEQSTTGTASLAIGQLKVASKITFEAEDAIFAVLHFGSHDFQCKISGLLSSTEFSKIKSHLMETFHQQSLTQVVRELDHYFPGDFYSLKDLFLEERRSILYQIAVGLFRKFEKDYFALYRRNMHLLKYYREMDTPLPKEFENAVQYVFSRQLEKLIRKEESVLGNLDYSYQIKEVIHRSEIYYISIDLANSGLQITEILNRKVDLLAKNWDHRLILDLIRFVKLSHDIKAPVDLWHLENQYFLLKQYPPMLSETDRKASDASFAELGTLLGFAVN